MTGSAHSLLDTHLARAREWAAARDWSALAAAGRASVPAEALAVPELAYLYADSFWRVGEPARTLEWVEALEPAVRRGAGARLLLRVVNLGGMAAFEAGDTAAAEGRFAELLELASELGEDEFTARASNNLGVLANVRGSREVALTYYQRALAAYHRLGHLRGLAQTHYNLALSYREIGFLKEAETHYESAARFAEQGGSLDVLGLAESDRGLLCLQAGDPAMAVALASLAHRRFQALGDPVRAAEAQRVLGLAAARQGRRDDALRLFDDALRTAVAHGNLILRAEVQQERGRELMEIRDPAAGAALEDAAAAFDALGAATRAAEVRALLARGR